MSINNVHIVSLCIQFGPQQQGTVVNPVAAALCALIVYSEFLIHPMVLLSTSRRMRQEVLRTLKRHSPCCCWWLEEILQSRSSPTMDLKLHVCTITSLSISHSSYQVTLFFLCKVSITQWICCFDLASMMSYQLSSNFVFLHSFRLIYHRRMHNSGRIWFTVY